MTSLLTQRPKSPHHHQDCALAIVHEDSNVAPEAAIEPLNPHYLKSSLEASGFQVVRIGRCLKSVGQGYDGPEGALQEFSAALTPLPAGRLPHHP